MYSFTRKDNAIPRFDSIRKSEPSTPCEKKKAPALLPMTNRRSEKIWQRCYQPKSSAELGVEPAEEPACFGGRGRRPCAYAEYVPKTLPFYVPLETIRVETIPHGQYFINKKDNKKCAPCFPELVNFQSKSNIDEVLFRASKCNRTVTEDMPPVRFQRI